MHAPSKDELLRAVAEHLAQVHRADRVRGPSWGYLETKFRSTSVLPLE